MLEYEEELIGSNTREAKRIIPDYIYIAKKTRKALGGNGGSRTHQRRISQTSPDCLLEHLRSMQRLEGFLPPFSVFIFV